MLYSLSVDAIRVRCFEDAEMSVMKWQSGIVMSGSADCHSLAKYSLQMDSAQYFQMDEKNLNWPGRGLRGTPPPPFGVNFP